MLKTAIDERFLQLHSSGWLIIVFKVTAPFFISMFFSAEAGNVQGVI